MYSTKENVNILTSLLVAHGVSRAVVCPGSRNAPIVHNLNACPQILCFPVTDERSAGFYALGMAQATDEPVVVCVTSGSALLNVLPAVAEAAYQHQSLIVVSADRPEAWIDQLDGQTLPQPGALGRFVAMAVSLPEPQTAEQRWHCNRLVNEALLMARKDVRPCVHINVPISEPLFDFTQPELPRERVIMRYAPTTDYDCLPTELVEDLLRAERPMLLFGQSSPALFSGEGVDYLLYHVINLHEALSPLSGICHFDEVLYRLSRTPEEAASLMPDFLLYVGDAVVSKRLKAFLRRAGAINVWRVSASGDVEDTFMNLKGIVVGDVEFVLQSLSHKLSKRKAFPAAQRNFRREWLSRLRAVKQQALAYEPDFSQMAVVRAFEARLQEVAGEFEVHYANSSAVRLANLYAPRHVWCNRGVNGIEGSLSTAAGFSTVYPQKVFCVVGDLSFFYDQNALWNQNLGGNLRVLLLNNGRGGIFNMLPGLEQSEARDRLVAASHSTTAEGICRQNGVLHRRVVTKEQLDEALLWLASSQSDRPLLLEVHTDAAEDERVFRHYYQQMLSAM